jgi:hypothetical protein
MLEDYKAAIRLSLMLKQTQEHAWESAVSLDSQKAVLENTCLYLLNSVTCDLQSILENPSHPVWQDGELE